MKNPSSSSADLLDARPWFREPWPWIVMAGPAAVIVAGAITTWIAFSNRDGLVADDYYKRGLAINKVIAKEEVAERLGLSLALSLEPRLLKIRLQGDAPAALFVHLVYATREGNDLRLRLARTAEGTYETELPALAPGHWRAVVEDPQARWRIVKDPL